MVLPLLIGERGLDVSHADTDHLTKMVLENCANNYAQTLSFMKQVKKGIRKKFCIHPLINRGLGGTPAYRMFASYIRMYWKYMPSTTDVVDRARHCCLWTQTRAMGLADNVMIERSYVKFLNTVQKVSLPNISVNRDTLDSILRPSRLTGREAHISCGPKACLEKTQKNGGQVSFLATLARRKVVSVRYNLDTLEPTFLEPSSFHRVRDAQSTLDWAISFALGEGIYRLTPRGKLSSRIITRSTRTHCVAEPGKARLITVASYSYQVIMGVFARALTACLYNRQSISGLKADRHLWNFCLEELSQESLAWEHLSQGRVESFSTDLEEATDHINWYWCKEVFSSFLRALERVPNANIRALVLLGKHLYCNRRYVFYPELKGQRGPTFTKAGNQVESRGPYYRLLCTNRGAFMGDMFTKVVLTVTTDYAVAQSLKKRGPWNGIDYQVNPLDDVSMRDAKTLLRGKGSVLGKSSRQGTSSNVGDDVITYQNDDNPVEILFRAELRCIDGCISEDDTFTSKWFSFYCEEMAKVFQRPWDAPGSTMRVGKTKLGYIDYPRIRLLLDTKSETDLYSSTNSGRLVLLGKEARWVKATKVDPLMHHNASILQHLLLKKEKETLCPFIPLEIGGDGSFSLGSEEFLANVIAKKAHDPDEVMFRIQSLLDQTWARKFVHHPETTAGLQKGAVLLPTLKLLKDFLPEGSVITPANELERDILDSCSGIKKGLFETPTKAFFKVLKRIYYQTLFRTGQVQPDIRLVPHEGPTRGQTMFSKSYDELLIILHRFMNQWVNPGFKFRDLEPYYVIPIEHPDYLSVGWNWGPVRPQEEPSLAGLTLAEVVKAITEENPLLTQRMHQFFESDSFLKGKVNRERIHGNIILISQDKRLAQELMRLASRYGPTTIWLVHPVYARLGMLQEIVPRSDYYLEDIGSLGHWDIRVQAVIRRKSFLRMHLPNQIREELSSYGMIPEHIDAVVKGVLFTVGEYNSVDLLDLPLARQFINWDKLLSLYLEGFRLSPWVEREDHRYPMIIEIRPKTGLGWI
jgi:hypothetical protein